MKHACLLLAVLILFPACASETPHRKDPANMQLPAPPSIDEVAIAMDRDSRPTDRHRALDVFLGAWDTTAFTVDAEGRESDPKPGRAAIEWIFGHRYLRWDASLELSIGTRSTTGYLGFSAFQDEYQLLFISDLSTGMSVARGIGDPRSGGIRFTLELVDPRSGAMHRALSVLKSFDAEHFVLEQLGGEGADTHVVRRTYYRHVKT